MPRSFRLILSEETFDRWKLYYPNHGIRQAIMRRVVGLMIDIAEKNIPNTEEFFNAEIKMILGRFEKKM